MESKARSIPNFIKAGSPQGLRRSMLMTNVRLKSFVHYYDISSYQEKGKTVWIAWFFEPIGNDDPIFDPKAGE